MNNNTKMDRHPVYKVGNIHAAMPEIIPEEIEQTLLSAGLVSIRRIVSRGQCNPVSGWYDQEDNEWVLVLEGEGVLAFEGEEDLPMKQGDYCFIPARKKHRVKWTPPERNTVWLAFHFPVQPQAGEQA